MRTSHLLLLLLVLAGCNGDTRAYFARDVVDVKEDVAYLATNNPRQELDLYLPRKVARFPVAVFVHGGYWIAQDKRYFAAVTGLYGNIGFALARQGIGVVVINYRLVPDVSFDDQLADVLASVAWTQAHIAEYGSDPERIVVGGHSAGGHMTALAAFQPDRLAKAGVDTKRIRGWFPLSPILDLEDMAAHPPDADFNARVTSKVFGERLKDLSPRTYFSATTAPIFIAMGEEDEPYLRTQIPADVAELAALGAPVTLVKLPKQSHADVVLKVDTDDDTLTPQLVAFIKRVTM